MILTGLTNDEIREYLTVPPGAAVETALQAIEKVRESCRRCEGMGVEIIEMPDPSARYGFKRVARRCDHKPLSPVVDGKLAA